MAVFMLVGCAHHTPYPKNDVVLTYNRPFDYTYLGVLTAIESLTDWKLGYTEKNNGLIVLQNQKYWDFFDSDKREAVIQVRRVDAKRTSVQLAPESQRVVDGKLITDAIDKELGKFRV